jgi:lipoate-protein ligase A
MTQFRLLLTGDNPAAKNMAIDEAIMRECSHTGMPTVRLYSWKPAAVSIGYFQAIEEEVDLQRCKQLEIDVVRRITGGGAVFHDAELTYSFACREDSGILPKNILESYSQICNSLVLGLEQLGLTSRFVALNDVVVNNKKISGSAQTRRNGIVLQHGTILIKVDVEKMFSLLKVPDEKIRDKIIQNVKQRVTSIEEQTGREIYFQEVAEAITNGFSENFNAELAKGRLSIEESVLAEKIEKERFSAKEWNYLR